MTPPAMITEIDSAKKRHDTGLISYSPYKFAGYCKGALTKAFLVKEKTEAKR